jgi:pyrroloquinoline quinone biosynthesis protein E
MVNAPRPLGLLAELTHRCPLHCPYCSNPLQLALKADEMPVEVWKSVLLQASRLGVLQVGLSGGEPLLYPGLVELVAEARARELYTNLITSGLGLGSEKIRELKAAGIDTVQLSFQSDEKILSDSIAGTRSHEAKLLVAEELRRAEIPFSINVVLHRKNIDRLEEMVRLAEKLGAIRIELANVQFYGWAFRNRGALLPTKEQVIEADRITRRERARLEGAMQVIYVLPDYYERRPKPCLHGWGRRGLTVNPAGYVMPCQAADCIPDLRFENVQSKSLEWIWLQSEAFNRFRGTEWMMEPCRSCEFREMDFGGCRCQAALLTGEAGRTDPVCEFSPDRQVVDRILDFPEKDSPVVFRSSSPVPKRARL